MPPALILKNRIKYICTSAEKVGNKNVYIFLNLKIIIKKICTSKIAFKCLQSDSLVLLQYFITELLNS